MDIYIDFASIRTLLPQKEDNLLRVFEYASSSQLSVFESYPVKKVLVN